MEANITNSYVQAGLLLTGDIKDRDMAACLP